MRSLLVLSLKGLVHAAKIAEMDASELDAFAAAVQPIYAEARAFYPGEILKLLPRGM